MREGTKDAFQDLAGVFTFRNILLKDDGTPEQVRSAVVTTNFFRLVGAKIVLGRDFTDADGMPQPPAPPGAQPGVPTAPPLPIMAILSYEYFQRRYGLNPSVIGQVMITNGPFRPQIVGVLAPGFQLYFPSSTNVEPVPEVWLANRLGYDNANRNGGSIHAVGRLRDGVSLERAQAAADNVAAEARKKFLIERTAGYAIRVEPMRQHLVSEVRPAILALMGAVIFLLLIACANVANLLLVRASLRRPELAVRSALGAGRWRIMQQMLAEAVLLTAIGAAIGVALARAGVRELLALAPANLPRLSTIALDSSVLAWTVAISLAAAAFFGLTPAWGAFALD